MVSDSFVTAGIGWNHAGGTVLAALTGFEPFGVLEGGMSSRARLSTAFCGV